MFEIVSGIVATVSEIKICSNVWKHKPPFKETIIGSNLIVMLEFLAYGGNASC